MFIFGNSQTTFETEHADENHTDIDSNEIDDTIYIIPSLAGTVVIFVIILPAYKKKKARVTPVPPSVLELGQCNANDYVSEDILYETPTSTPEHLPSNLLDYGYKVVKVSVDNLIA